MTELEYSLFTESTILVDNLIYFIIANKSDRILLPCVGCKIDNVFHCDPSYWYHKQELINKGCKYSPGIVKLMVPVKERFISAINKDSKFYKE